jgi:1,3,6,8-tetrahydroxynaphthalene synthase
MNIVTSRRSQAVQVRVAGPTGRRARSTERDPRPTVTTSVMSPCIVVPEHRVAQEDVIRLLVETYSEQSWVEDVVHHVRACNVDTRHFVLPLPELVAARPFGERNRLYAQEVVRLGVEAAHQALQRARVEASEIDALVFVSCTGYMLPGPDAYIAQELGCRPTISRTPIQQLGCAAGGSALAKAHDYLTGHPGSRALVVAVELPSLSYQPTKNTVSDFISNALFGDAAAAAVLQSDEHGREAQSPGFEIHAGMQHLLPESTDLIYGETSELGFHFWTNPGARRVVAKIAPALLQFLADHGLAPGDLEFCVSHTGGPLIMDAVEKCLGLAPGTVDPSRASLAELGNCSSVSVLDVLRRHHDAPPRDNSPGMLIAFGPGFTTEALLGHWRGEAGTRDDRRPTSEVSPTGGG